jgi:hypothetical protein
MATFADVWSRLFVKGMERAGHAVRRMEPSTRVRPFANEDILFYVKRIDNTGVVRASDPAARGICWKLIGSMVGAAVLLIGVLLPSAYGRMAGYQIESLRQESQRIAAEQASLELKEAELLSPARMEELAREQQFVDPAPQKVVYLDGQGQPGTLAMNGK